MTIILITNNDFFMQQCHISPCSWKIWRNRKAYEMHMRDKHEIDLRGTEYDDPRKLDKIIEEQQSGRNVSHG